MVPIRIDLNEVIEEFNLTATQTLALGTSIIDRIVTDYTTKWEGLVNKNLGATRNLYKNAMFVNRISDMEVEFGIKTEGNELPLMIEEGASPFNLKKGFSESAKKKTSLGGGWYITVPFRYATSQSVADTMLFQGVLPKGVQQIAVRNNGSPVCTNQLPEQYRMAGRRKEIKIGGTTIPAYTHKAPQFTGLVKVNISTTPDKNRGGYFTFRRVSDKSDPNSWIHPGFEPKKFMEQALDMTQVPQITDIVIDEFLQKY